MNILGALLPGLFRVIEEIVPDGDKRNELKTMVQLEVLSHQRSLLEAQSQIIQAEAKSQSWLTRTWRPLSMVSFLFIVLWRTFFGPLIASIFGIPVESLVLPMDPAIEGQLFTLITVGLGGYVVGRSGEQIARAAFSHRQNDSIINDLRGDRSNG
jgi:hypothetical protein